MLRALNSYVMPFLPTDIARGMLMGLSYNNTVEYCSTSDEAMRICSDNLFWKEKLDTRYTSNNRLKPSDYMKYLNPALDNRYEVIYEKWEYTIELPFLEVVEIAYNVSDVIMYKLDSNPNTIILPYIGWVVRAIIYSGSVLALEELLNRGLIQMSNYWVEKLIMDAIRYNRVDILNFLEQRNLSYDISKHGLIKIDTYQFDTISIDMIKWLMKRNILYMKNIIGYAIAYDRFDIVYYLEESGISPEQSDVNIVITHNRIGHITDKLDWLAEHGILSSTYR